MLIACPDWPEFPHRVVHHHALIVHHYHPQPAPIDTCVYGGMSGGGSGWSEIGYIPPAEGVLYGGGNVSYFGIGQRPIGETPTWFMLVLGFGVMFGFARKWRP